MSKRPNDSLEDEPRKLHSLRSDTIILTAPDTPTPTPSSCIHQKAWTALETVLLIPELVEKIGQYLCAKDHHTLIHINRSWNAAWVPFLYPSQTLQNYRRSSSSFNIEKYGCYIRTMDLSRCRTPDIIHLLEYTPHLVGLSISACTLTVKELETILTSAAPNLRTLHYRVFPAPSEHSSKAFALAACLTNLEELSWHDQRSKILVEDVLVVLRSCRHLRSLSLHDVTLAEGEPESESEKRIKQSQGQDEWTSTTLTTLDCSGLRRWVCNSDNANPACVTHACIRRLFERIPKVSRILFKGGDGYSPFDWDYIFRKCSLVQHVTIQIQGLVHMASPGAMEALVRHCSKVKTLQYSSSSPSNGYLFTEFVFKNPELEKISVESSNFGDTALASLLQQPLSLTPLKSLPTTFRNESLTELNLRHCVNVTDEGARLLLERCSRLCHLYLRGSNAGSIELFEGRQPWACAASLRKLSVDLHPRNYVLRHTSVGGIEGEQLSMAVNYGAAEEITIRKKLGTLIALKELHLSGRALTSGIVCDLPDSGLELVSLGYIAGSFLRSPPSLDLRMFQQWSRSPVQIRQSVYGNINIVVLRRQAF